MAKKIDRDKFILLVQTGALTCDRQYDRRLAHGLVHLAMTIPDELFCKGYGDEYTYTCDLLDFEYGMFDMFGEEYPDWIKKYFKWKQSGRHTSDN